MIRRSQSRPVRPAVVRRPRQARKKSFAKNISDTQKYEFEYCKIALNFMLLSNGSGATIVLANMDTEKYIAPLYIFSIGVLISMLLSVFFLLSLKHKTPPQSKKLHKLFYFLQKGVDTITPFVFISPIVLFGAGIYFMQNIIDSPFK